jgi:hypothetical protein
MRSFKDHFSDEAIIQELCRARITLATTRHDAAFFHNISESSAPAHDILPQNWGKIPVDIFPPRSVWHRFRPKHRAGLQAADINYRALCCARIAAADAASGMGREVATGNRRNTRTSVIGEAFPPQAPSRHSGTQRA